LDRSELPNHMICDTDLLNKILVYPFVYYSIYTEKCP